MVTNFLRKPARGLYDGLFKTLSKSPIPISISIQTRECGFFGDTAITLNALRFAELYGIDCSVEWGSKSLYFDKEAGPNVWEYCFEKASFSFRKSGKKAKFSIPYFATPHEFKNYPGLSERESLDRAIAKFCQPTSEVSKIIEDYITENFAPMTLGVHYRGTDAAAGFENRKVTTLVQLEKAIESWLEQNPEGNVFLATDEVAAVERLTSRFPGSIHSRDCVRSTDGKSIHGHYDNGVNGTGREKCIDVLVDATLLSRCNALCARGSRVVWFATAMNSKLDILKMPKPEAEEGS